MPKKLLIAGYPKSGNTWLGYMLAYILGAKYIDLHQPDQPTTKKKNVLDLISGGLAHTSEYSTVEKSHNLPNKVAHLEDYDKVIQIVRDPRDVAVSYYFFRFRLLPIELHIPILLHISRLKISQFFLWKHTMFTVAREWPFHMLCWKTVDPLVIRYEDLHKDTMGTLQKIMAFLKIPADQTLLKKAVESFSFEEMSGGRRQGVEDSYHFYRKGIIGDFANYLDRIDRWIIQKSAGEEMKKLGYGL